MGGQGNGRQTGPALDAPAYLALSQPSQNVPPVHLPVGRDPNLFDGDRHTRNSRPARGSASGRRGRPFVHRQEH